MVCATLLTWGRYWRDLLSIFPEGSVLSRGLSQSTQIVSAFSFVVLNVIGKVFRISANTFITRTHTVYDREMCGICKGMIHRFVPQIWVASSPGPSQIYLAVVEKNREKAWDQNYVTNRKWWTQLVQTESTLRTDQVHHFWSVT